MSTFGPTRLATLAFITASADAFGSRPIASPTPDPGIQDLPTSYRFIINSCGDITGEPVYMNLLLRLHSSTERNMYRRGARCRPDDD